MKVTRYIQAFDVVIIQRKYCNHYRYWRNSNKTLFLLRATITFMFIGQFTKMSVESSLFVVRTSNLDCFDLSCTMSCAKWKCAHSYLC